MISKSNQKKSRRIDRIASILLLLVSSFMGIAIVELAWRIFAKAPVYEWDRRIMFFEGKDTIFRNIGRIFTYVPNNSIHSKTVYFSNHGFEVEYDYRYQTNNFGLVQKNDIVPSKSSVLVLGDSFTEGQGAEPWFAKLNPRIESLGYQAVNGGILATGFGHWSQLENYLVENGIQIQRVIVVFISSDYGRLIFNFRANVLQCLSDLKSCDGREDFYRLPPDEQLPAWVSKIRDLRKHHSGFFERFAPATSEVFGYINGLIKLRKTHDMQRLEEGRRQAQESINRLINKYGTKNIVFVHIPQKDEIVSPVPGPNALGLEARNAIRDAGARLFDGFGLCGMTKDDYFINDGHPNARGYDKIADCISRIATEFLAAPSLEAVNPNTMR